MNLHKTELSTVDLCLFYIDLMARYRRKHTQNSYPAEIIINIHYFAEDNPKNYRTKILKFIGSY